MGLESEDLLAQASDLSEADLELFRYPHDKELEAVGVRGIYLNNYLRWDTKAQHEDMIDTYGYEPFPQLRTFDSYNDMDSFHYSGLHDYIKLLKWGYGKVSDHVSREIRLRRLTREDGIEMVSRYERIPPADLPLFLEWLGMNEEEFWPLFDAHRDPQVWGRDKEGRWMLRDSVTQHDDVSGVDAARLLVREPYRFRTGPSKVPDMAEDRYVLVGRGWVDGWGREKAVRTSA